MTRRTDVTIAAVILIGAPLVAGAAGALATTSAPQFYGQIARPDWSPPAWIFGPVWTLLYVLMGVAAFLVWRRTGWSGALALFFVQLVFNVLWSWLFFYWRLGPASVADIALLWLLIVALVIAFWRARPIAGALLLPYLAWVTFAAALNVAIVRMNASV